jgi:2-polyprenyl-3-methyl-5-hydroxy-6-metoxy-1,4-benzoquinol methylase
VDGSNREGTDPKVTQESTKLDISRMEQQRHFYDEECDPEFEIVRPHDCGQFYDFLIENKFRTGLETLGMDLLGRSVLEICCGSGMMSEKFSRRGAVVTAIDMSEAAIERARERAKRYDFAASFSTGDAEHLEFGDRSFDVVAVHDGLHHLDEPQRAISEMARVARRAVLIMDPARALLTRVAVRLGLSVDVEDAGNVVKRLSPSEVSTILRGCGFNMVMWRRTLMYYPHQPNRWFKILDYPLAFPLAKAAFQIANLAIGRWGNKLSLAAVRS